MIKLKLDIKMLIIIMTVSVIILGVVILVIRSNVKSADQQSAAKHSDIITQTNTSYIKGYMDKYMTNARSLSYFLLSFENLDIDVRRNTFNNIFESVLNKNEELKSIWSVWEPNVLDGRDSLYVNVKGNTYNGSFSPAYFKDGTNIKLKEISESIYEDDRYVLPRQHNESVLMDPYYDDYLGEMKMQTSFIVPLMYSGRFIGVVGVDIPLDSLQEFINQVKPFNNSYEFLLSSNGIIVAHQQAKFVGKPRDILKLKVFNNKQLSRELQWNQKVSFSQIDSLTNIETHFMLRNVTIGGADNNWIFGLAIPEEEFNQASQKIVIISIIASLIALGVFSFLLYLFFRYISRPIVCIKKVIDEISMGNIDESLKIPIKSNDEISDIAISVNKLIDGLNSTALFAKQIGQGDLDADYKMLSGYDQLGKSLVDMRESLKQAYIFEQKKQEEDTKHAWVTQGLARFGEILREDNDNMERFSVNICRNLCEYMKIPQSAMFIVEEENNDILYEMKALYAYGAQKPFKKKIKKGEELVGRAISEKKTIHLKDLPEHFASITTGNSSDSIPTHILYVPMLMNEEPYGALELMGIDPFEIHHIDFAEKVAVSIAATVSSIKTNLRTAQLLSQSEELKDDLSQQEEEMRQNLEEMEATQEEAQSRESELTSVKAALKKLIMLVECDTEGRIISISRHMAEAYGHIPESMEGKFQDAFVTEDDTSRRKFLKFWNEVLKGVTKKRINEIKRRDKTIYLSETYIPIMDDERISSILNVSIDITKKVELDKEITQLVNKINDLKDE